MGKQRLQLRYLLLVLIFWGGMNGQLVFGQQIQAYAVDGDEVLYFDINARGQIIKNNYAKQTGKVIGKIDFRSKELTMLWQGWVRRALA